MQKKLSAFLSSSLLTAGIAGISLGYNVTPVQAFELNFGAASESSNTEATGSSAKVDFKFTQSGENVLVNLDIFNTTGDTTFGSGATESTLMGFAFDLLDGITIGSFTGSNYFGNIASNVDLQPFDTFDVGISRNSNFLGGNPNGGLTQGLSSSVSFLLSGANLLAETLEQDFFKGFSDGTLKWATRFQAVNAGAGSDKLLGGTITGGPVVEVEQPEVEQPEVEQPEVEQPEVEQPEVEQPEVEQPEIEQPEVEQPEVEQPEVEQPEVEQPEVEQPEVEQPEVEQPEVEQPEVEQPEVVDPQPPAPPVEPELPSEPQPPAPPAEPNYPTEDNPTNNVSVPEPGTLFGLGLVGTLVGLRRRKA